MMCNFDEFEDYVLTYGDVVKEGRAISVSIDNIKITCNIENSLIETIETMFDIYEKKLSSSPIGWDNDLQQYFFRDRKNDEKRNDWHVVTNANCCSIEDFPELAECAFRPRNAAEFLSTNTFIKDSLFDFYVTSCYCENVSLVVKANGCEFIVEKR